MTGQSSTAHLSPPRVTVAMATFNGAQHLEAQLASIKAQEGVEWDLWVSDDGSTDDTRKLLSEFERKHSDGRTIRILEGPRRGSAANFLSLLNRPDLPKSQPVALSDQDDVWKPEKLRRAVDVLSTLEPVALYSAQSFHTDDTLAITGRSTFPKRSPSFQNALVQNIVSGHSAVISPGGMNLIRAAGQPRSVPFHDWWLYLLFSGSGADIHIDTARTVLYRQHGKNALGAHHGLSAKFLRFRQVFGQTYSQWIRCNISALSSVKNLLKDENINIIKSLECDQGRNITPRTLRKLRIHRQDTLSNWALFAAASLGKI